MVIRILPIMITLFLGWNYKRHRNFLLLTILTIAIGVILSIIVVFPINEAIMAKAGQGKTPDEVKQMVKTWILADRLRFGIIFTGYIFLLWAFRLPLSKSKEIPAKIE